MNPNNNDRSGFNPEKSVDPAANKGPEDLARGIYALCSDSANRHGMSHFQILGAIEVVKINIAQGFQAK